MKLVIAAVWNLSRKMLLQMFLYLNFLNFWRESAVCTVLVLLFRKNYPQPPISDNFHRQWSASARSIHLLQRWYTRDHIKNIHLFSNITIKMTIITISITTTTGTAITTASDKLVVFVSPRKVNEKWIFFSGIYLVWTLSVTIFTISIKFWRMITNGKY